MVCCSQHRCDSPHAAWILRVIQLSPLIPSPVAFLGGSSVLWMRHRKIDRLVTEALQVFSEGSEVFPSILSTSARPVAVMFNLLHWRSVSGKATLQGIQPRQLFLQYVGASGSLRFSTGEANSTSCTPFSRSLSAGASLAEVDLCFVFQYATLTWCYWQVWELHRWRVIATL